MPRRRSRRVRISLRVTLDPDIDGTFLELLARTPKGRRASLIRDLLRSSYAELERQNLQQYQDDRQDEWLDYIAAEDDNL